MSEPLTIEQRLTDLENFRLFAQPIVINAERLFTKIHEREGIKDYFQATTHHASPLVQLGQALDVMVKPITDLPPPPEIGESVSVL